jgi:hypothetical protein
VRGWLESRPDANAAAGEQRDATGVAVPADRLRDVASFLVLGEEAHERTGELAMERREDERQRRLRHASVRRKAVRERAKALARGESLDEPGER